MSGRSKTKVEDGSAKDQVPTGKKEEASQQEPSSPEEEENVLVFKQPLWALGVVAQKGGDYIVLAGGGGGTAKTGIRNEVIGCTCEGGGNVPKLHQQFVHTLDDSVKNMAVFDKNLKGAVAALGVGRFCEVFAVSKKGVTQVIKVRTDFLEEIDLSVQNCVAFSPNGKKLVTGGSDGSIRIWAYPEASLLQEIKHPHGENAVSSVTWSPDGSRLASCGGDKRLVVFCQSDDLFEQQTVIVYKGLNFRACYFSMDNNSLFTAQTKSSSKSYVSQWKLPSGKEKKSVTCFPRSEEPCTAFAMSPDGKYLAAGSAGGHIAIWEVIKFVLNERQHANHTVTDCFVA